MKSIQRISAFVVLLSVSTLAFAGGPVSNFPVQEQLQQEVRMAQAVLNDVHSGGNRHQLMQRVQALNFAVQNTASQMRVTPPAASHMVRLHATRRELVKHVEVVRNWIVAQQKA
ncbi:hypothetical protein HF673_14935 [Acidithiobacillus thiooxidans]|uniref:Uncharacterized protein n=3 Tax=Acidithiobacillus TaxID=119977 RepID=A0A1C2IVJ4_ACITH|nr:MULTISPECIES: hypothetical protein [Acidithiobacillus]MBU2742269.1 hypothetical protein [Acidithiobacillus albertensis]MBU2758846.1 hypothetical protein [Acidithiobacillus sulfurivorans]MBU2837023.1 hypothetical protein [Acidithiobacillus thiooxidans]OCX68127.1 hypothetical protein A6M23_18965 [Acidithiobacillus thiooxidans]OCX80031.1 hypothetical protein A6P08_17095 [Acidithiobacillus thiooxidans]